MQGWWQNSDEHVQDVIRYLGPRRCTSANWQYENVLFNIDGPVATVRLNDPRSANGITSKFNSALTDMAVELHSRRDVKVVVFVASGAYFCTGGAFGGNASEDDFLYAPKVEDNLTELETSVAMNMPTALLFYLINTLPQYKVASIRGKNMGAGNSLIASMDYVFAPQTKKTGLSFMESTRALAFCMSWQGILSKIGVPKTRSLVLISDELDARGGMAAGLIDEVIEEASAEASMRMSDDKAAAKGLEVSKLSDEEIKKLKKTGPGGTKTTLLSVPTAARGCQALQGHVADYKGAVDEVIAKCGRTGRPAPARLSKEMWPHDVVKLERSGQHVAIIKLTNAKAGNPLGRALVHGLLDAAIELHRSVGKVRLICIQAEGDVFCSGLGDSRAPDDAVSAEDEQLQQMLFLFWMLPMYVMGFVEGKVTGHGIAWTSTFDALAVKNSAEFDFTGLTVDRGGEFVAYRTGLPVLEELCNKGGTRSAEEVRCFGLATMTYRGEQDRREHIESVCEKVCSCAPNAVADSKAALQVVGSQTVDMSVLEFMSLHVAKRNIDPEFNDAIMAISMPTHKPAFNRHEHNSVVPPHKMAEAAQPFMLKDKEAKTKPKGRVKATAPMSVMI